MKILKIIYIFIFLSLISCSTFSGNQGLSKYIETFYTGNEGVQYFIKPLEFERINSDESLLVDYTFRFLDTIKGNVTVNFTIVSNKFFKQLDNIEFEIVNNKFKYKTVNLLFNENIKGKWHSRFTTGIPLSDFVKISNDIYFITINDIDLKFSPTKKTQNTLKYLKDNLLVIF